MDKNYIKFIIAYDFGWIFDTMELACDEAYELAEELYKRYVEYLKAENKEDYYDILNQFLNEISFNRVWEELHHES